MIEQREVVNEHHEILNGGNDVSLDLQELQKPCEWQGRGTLNLTSNAKVSNGRVTTVPPRMS